MLISLYNAVDKYLQALQMKTIDHIDIIDVLYEMTSYVAKRMEVNLKETEYHHRKAAVVFEHCFHRELYFK